MSGYLAARLVEGMILAHSLSNRAEVDCTSNESCDEVRDVSSQGARFVGDLTDLFAVEHHHAQAPLRVDQG